MLPIWPSEVDVHSSSCLFAARFGCSATVAAAGDPFRALASARALAEIFELVVLLGMLEGVSRGDGTKCGGARKDRSGAEG